MPDRRLPIFVALLPEWLPHNWHAARPMAVVIDTLRFTTTATAALAAGGLDIQVAAEIDQARRLAEATPGGALKCGERHCHRIEGFDLGNSPHEFTSGQVAGRRLVFSTTNGTRSVAAASRADTILLAGLVNRRAVCEALMAAADERPLWIICAGTDGEIAYEDVLTAGAILAALPNYRPANDAAVIALRIWAELSGSAEEPSVPSELLVQALQRGAGGQNLLNAGYAEDIEFAARLDSLDVVPRTSGRWDQFAAAGSVE